jgi:hypothetical protein
MKTCTVRRRFWATEADSATVEVDLEPGFGIPKGAIIYFIENNSDTDAFDTSLGFRNCGIGFVGSGVTECVIFTLQDGVNPTSSQRAHFGTRFISATNTARAVTHYRVDVVTFSADKISLTFTNQTPQTNGHLEALIWAVTGDDVTVGVGYSTFNSTNGSTREYSGLSFQPDLVFLASSNNTLNQSVSADAFFSFGAATRSPLQQAGVGWSYRTNVATVEGTLRESSTFISQFATGRAALSNITNGGWTVTTTGTITANTVYNFFAIKSQSPSDFALLNVNTPTSTGVNFTGLGTTGFIPETLLGACTFAQTRDSGLITNATGASGFGLLAGTATSYSKLYNGAGTITYSTANSTVTGSSTVFWKFFPGTRLYTLSGEFIGTVSTVASATSLTLVANPSFNGTGQNYTFSSFRQGCLLIGDNDASTGSQVYSQASSRLYTVADGTPSVVVQGYLNDFDTRAGLQIGYSTVSASQTFGWIVACKNQTNSRRRARLS